MKTTSAANTRRRFHETRVDGKLLHRQLDGECLWDAAAQGVVAAELQGQGTCSDGKSEDAANPIAVMPPASPSAPSMKL